MLGDEGENPAVKMRPHIACSAPLARRAGHSQGHSTRGLTRSARARRSLVAPVLFVRSAPLVFAMDTPFFQWGALLFSVEVPVDTFRIFVVSYWRMYNFSAYWDERESRGWRYAAWRTGAARAGPGIFDTTQERALQGESRPGAAWPGAPGRAAAL
jgi:hypothetical protein